MFKNKINYMIAVFLLGMCGSRITTCADVLEKDLNTELEEKLLSDATPDFVTINRLLKAGADPYAHGSHGNEIIAIVMKKIANEADLELLEKLSKQIGAIDKYEYLRKNFSTLPVVMQNNLKLLELLIQKSMALPSRDLVNTLDRWIMRSGAEGKIRSLGVGLLMDITKRMLDESKQREAKEQLKQEREFREKEARRHRKEQEEKERLQEARGLEFDTVEDLGHYLRNEPIREEGFVPVEHQDVQPPSTALETIGSFFGFWQ